MLSALGVKIGLDPAALSRCLDEAGLCFMFAQTHHASMRHVAPVRVELGTRTLFNLLGPLSNPAGVKRQLLGVPSPVWLEPLTEALKELGSGRVWAVHGSDGLDEITTTGPTAIVALENGTVRRFTITPEEVGIARAKPDDLKGADPDAQRPRAAGRPRRRPHGLPRHRRPQRRRRPGRRRGSRRPSRRRRPRRPLDRDGRRQGGSRQARRRLERLPKA